MYKYWQRWGETHLELLTKHEPWRPQGCCVPGNITDITHKCFRKFNKWIKRPKTAHKLYWKLH